MTYLIGVDCGGTHIVGQTWTNDTTAQPYQEAIAGPGNVLLDFDGAMQNLTSVLDQLVNPLPVDQIEYILIGVAGIETAGLTEQVQQIITQRYHIAIDVISDAKLALLNGLSGEDGALVIAGTGSVVYGRQNGQFLRVGGWGAVLGDEGSAYDIARRALKQVLTQVDAGQTSQLTPAILKQLQAPDIAAAVKQFYAQNRQTNAKLALPIAELATRDDPEAVMILTTATQSLAEQIMTIYQRFTDPKPTKVALSGSVLQKNPIVRTAIIDAVQRELPKIKFINIDTNNAHAVIYWHKWTNQGGIQA